MHKHFLCKSGQCKLPKYASNNDCLSQAADRLEPSTAASGTMPGKSTSQYNRRAASTSCESSPWSVLLKHLARFVKQTAFYKTDASVTNNSLMLQLAERLSSLPVAAIYSSDLQRTMQTAHYVATRLEHMQVWSAATKLCSTSCMRSLAAALFAWQLVCVSAGNIRDRLEGAASGSVRRSDLL